MKDYLTAKTKGKIITFLENHTSIEYDKTLTKSALIRHIIENEDKIDSYPDDYVASSNLEVTVIKHEPAPVHEVDINIRIEDEFTPKWRPSYRHQGELFQVVASDVISSYLRGVRDTYELQTIAYWVSVQGELLVRDATNQSFITLR